MHEKISNIQIFKNYWKYPEKKQIFEKKKLLNCQ